MCVPFVCTQSPECGEIGISYPISGVSCDGIGAIDMVICCCCRLVVQRTKRVDDTQDLLLEMLENLTSGTEREKQEFMTICVETLKRFKMSDVLTPIFVFERLCSIIHPVSDVGLTNCSAVKISTVKSLVLVVLGAYGSVSFFNRCALLKYLGPQRAHVT